MYCADFLEIDRSRVHVISHAERLCILRDEPETGIWSNQVGMFELSENGLHYYELRVQRGLRGCRWSRIRRNWRSHST